MGWCMAAGPKAHYWLRNKGAEFRSASGERLVNRRAGGHMTLEVGIREIVSLEQKRLIERAR